MKMKKSEQREQQRITATALFDKQMALLVELLSSLKESEFYIDQYPTVRRESRILKLLPGIFALDEEQLHVLGEMVDHMGCYQRKPSDFDDDLNELTSTDN